MSYGAVNQTAIEMKPMAERHDEEDDPAAGFSHKSDKFTPRALAIYQSVLCFILIGLSLYGVMEYEMFNITDANSSLIPTAGTSVENFAAAFDVPKGAKKGTPPYEPDLIFLKTPSIKSWFGGEHGTWVWSHGDLYLMLPTAFLHAISGTLMDPELFHTEPPVDNLSGECFVKGGSRLACLESLMSKQLNDKNPPKGGYFAYATDESMEIFHYETEFGIKFVPVQASEIMTYTLMLVLSTFGTAILGATALTASAAYYATHQHKSYLKEYIAKGVFMHDEEHHDMFEAIYNMLQAH
jgi:hypothetical protein